VAPVLAGAEEEHLHAGMRALTVEREHIGLREARRVDALARIDMAHRANAVAQLRRALEIHPFGGLVHLPRELFLHCAALAREKRFRLGDERRVALAVDALRAGRAT